MLVAQSCLTLETPWTGACQAPISRQEYWSWLPFPSPGDLPDPGIKPRSPALAGRFFYCCTAGEALKKASVSISKEANSSNQTEGSGKMHAFGLFQTFRRKLMCSLLPLISLSDSKINMFYILFVM